MRAGVRTWHRMSGRRAAAVLAVPLVVAAGCNLIDPLDASLRAGFLTPEGDDDYGITIEGPATVSSAPSTNTGGNTRVAFWNADASATADHQSCTTWTESDHGIQPGIALRIRSEDGRTRAITVTKNVWYHAWWIFNFHVMDSGASTPYVQIGSVNVESGLIRDGEAIPGPLRLCARVVGDQLSLKVWPVLEPEPDWMDGVHGGGVLLPSGWETAGAPGWYVGHLPPGGSISYLDRVTSSGAPPPDTVTTAPATEAPFAPDTSVAGGTALPPDDGLAEGPPSRAYEAPTALLQAP